MTSHIKNAFYRALQRIEEETADGFKKYNAKTLALRIVDDLYPEDGYIALEDDPRGSVRVHLDERFMDRIRGLVAKGLNLKEATESVGLKEEVTVPMAEDPPNRANTGGAAPLPEIKEVKVKETKPKLTKEQKEAEKAAKEAAKAAKEAAKSKKEPVVEKPVEMAVDVEEITEKLAEMAVAPKKKAAAKPKFVGNLEKMNATHEKLWKKVAADLKIELTDDHKKRFLAQINALDNTVYNAKKLEVHMREFFTPKVPELKTEAMGMEPVVFKGKEYWVSDDGRVWETQTQENGTEVEKLVGRVGQLAFGDLEMPACYAK